VDLELIFQKTILLDIQHFVSKSLRFGIEYSHPETNISNKTELILLIQKSIKIYKLF